MPSNSHYSVKMKSSAVMSCACNVISHSVVFHRVTVVHNFLLNWTPNKWKTDKTIRSRAREPVNHVNRACEKDAIEKIVILLICCKKKLRCISNSKKKHQNGEQETHEGSPLHTPVQKRTWKPERNIITDDFYLCVVNRTVRTPTLKIKLFQPVTNSFQ